MAIDVQDRLNRMNPSADDVQLGDLLQELITNQNAILAKLDADAGITDTDYASTLALVDINAR